MMRFVFMAWLSLGDVLSSFLFISGAIPLWHAWKANRGWTLSHALFWTLAAWLMWMMALIAAAGGFLETARMGSFLALCLTACAEVAVLGARRPGVGAWNFVLTALLLVLLLPWAEHFLLGRNLELGVRMVFLGGTLALGVINYLPTLFGPAALLLAAACGLAMANLFDESPDLLVKSRSFSNWLLALVPWLAYLSLRGRGQPASRFDQRWLDFRDRFGLFWSQHVREQFNRSAANAGWPVYLRWGGLRLKRGTNPPDPSQHQEMVDVLLALLKRFGPGG